MLLKIAYLTILADSFEKNGIFAKKFLKKQKSY